MSPSATRTTKGAVINMKTKKEKPKYNALQNALYMCKLAWKYERAIPIHCLLVALLFLGQQLTDLYIAPTVLSAVDAAYQRTLELKG